MREIVVISGKGGTGKTSLTAAFAYLSKEVVVADCDVDAANLSLLLFPKKEESHSFIGGKKAKFTGNNTENCSKYINICRFGAIKSDCTVDPTFCEGCGACHFLTPEGTYSFDPANCGEWYIGRFGERKLMAYAELFPGEDNSGKLATLVRNQAAQLAKKNNIQDVIIDGPPGIGCPVIASITGVDRAVIVTEPTMSGLHDLERAFKLCEQFKVPVSVIVNKRELNPEYAKSIKDFCYERTLEFLGTIAYDEDFHYALSEGKTILEYNPESKASKDIKKIYSRLTEY